MLVLFSRLKEFFSWDIFLSHQFFIFILLVIAGVFVTLYFRTRRDLQNANYFLNIFRDVSRALARNHEIAAFNEEDDIIYTTHPQLYGNKEEFLQNLSNHVLASANYSNFCKFFESNSPYNTLLAGSGSGLHNQFKRWIATTTHLDSEDSFIDESISVVTMSDVSKQFSESEKAAVNYEKLENFLDHFPLGIFYVNNLGEILGANTTFANLVNVNREKLIGMSVKDFIEDFDYNVPAQKQVNISIKPRYARDFPAILVKSPTNALSSMQPWIACKLHATPEPGVQKSANNCSFF